MNEFIELLSDLPLIAILRGLEPGQAAAVAEVLVAADFRAVEVPLNSPDPLTSIRILAERFAGQVVIGAGTVRDAAAISQVATAGGRLIVMPHAPASLIRQADSLGLYCVPGVATPTEAFTALDAGADALKLFPAEALPPAVIKAWRAVLPSECWMLPVGGITPATMADYLAAGANGFGLGSGLFKPGMSLTTLADNARRYADAYRRAVQAH